MSGNQKSDKEEKVVLGVIAVIIIIGAVFYVATSALKEETPPDINVVEEEPEDLSGNKVVIQNENSQTAQGENLPTDVNFAMMLPRELGDENLVGVVDNKQVDYRKVTLRYKIAGDIISIKSSLINGLENLNWTINAQSEIITGTQEDKRIDVTIGQADIDMVYVDVLLTIYNEPIIQ